MNLLPPPPRSMSSWKIICPNKNRGNPTLFPTLVVWRDIPPGFPVSRCCSVYCPRYHLVVKWCQLVKPVASGIGLARSTFRQGRYLGRCLFWAYDVARNTSGNRHCFIRDHINNFHWCVFARKSLGLPRTLLLVSVNTPTQSEWRKFVWL